MFEVKDEYRKVVFTSKKIESSKDFDADNDGLKKIDEIINKTLLFSPDTDKDGLLDGEEVLSGYSPVVNEFNFKNNSLIRSDSTKKIYLLQNNTKAYIPNPSIFLQHQWKWSQVVNVSDKYLDGLVSAPDVR